MKILVFRLSAIGDIILTSALIRCLKTQIPNCTIDFVVKKQFASLVTANPNIDQVFLVDSTDGFSGLKKLAFELKQNEYDVFFDIHKNFRSQFVRRKSSPHKVLFYRKHVLKRALLTRFKIDLYNPEVPVYKRFISAANQIGVFDDGLGTEFFIQTDIIKSMAQKLFEHGIEPNQYITLCPGASFWNKQWPIDYLKELALLVLSNTDKRIVLIGGSKEESISKEIANLDSSILNLTGILNLQESAAVLQNTICTVVNDTGMLHLSEALNRPVVGIYGPTSKQLGYFPILKESTVVEKVGLKCRPCTKMGMNSCPKKHFKCMTDITPDSVFQAVLSYLPHV